MINNKSVGLLIIFSLLFILFTLKGLVLDPDFGWHLITGKYLLQHGIPQTDPFSYSMPSYHILDHEWAADSILSLLYSMMGMLGLALIYAGIAASSLLMQITSSKKWNIIPIVLSGVTLLLITGVKQQVLSWLLFSGLILFLRSNKCIHKFWFIMPIYFAIWANLHASFSLGLCILFIIIGVESIQNRKQSWGQWGIMLLSFLATLCNPYGVRIWQEVFITAIQPEIHFILAEWYPSFFVLYFPLWILTFISSILFWQYKQKFTLSEKVIWTILLTLGILSIRNIPYWIIFNLPLTCKTLELLAKDAQKSGEKQFTTIMNVFFICIVCISTIQGYFTFMQPQYPEKAAQYIQSHLPAGNIFSDFNWGGFILWKIPQKKIFIDGQMSNWQQNNNLENESSNSFQEFYWVANRAESLNTLTQKYHISMLLLTKKPFSSWQQGDINLFNVAGHQKYSSIEKQIQMDGWKKIYQDDIAIIYQKKQ